MENQTNFEHREPIKALVDETLASEIVYDLYGLRTTNIQEMNGYDDRNFYIQVEEEYENPYVDSICITGYTLKVVNKLDSKKTDFIDAMDCTLLNCMEKNLSVPIPVRNKMGSFWSTKLIPDKKNKLNLHVVRLLTHLSGETIYHIPYTASILFQWGKLLAKFHNSVKNFCHDALKERVTLWSLLNVPKILDFLFCIECEERRSMIYNIINDFKRNILNEVKNLPTGIIHGDFNEHNVLVRKIDKEYEVYAMIDFGDLHIGPIVFDVAIMLIYTMLECKTMDFIDASAHALAGYISVLPLSEYEIGILKVCMLSRLCQSLVLGAYTYSLDPTNQYALSSARMGWIILHKLWNTSDEQLHEVWRCIIKNN